VNAGLGSTEQKDTNGIIGNLNMDKEKFDLLEVRPPKNCAGEIGLYHVVLHNFTEDTYLYAWLRYDGNAWNYAEHQGRCLVCFIFDYREN